VEIGRPRDPDLPAACDARVDVGARNDPATGDYDHHQMGGAGERPDGIRYASFGLVWREHGQALAGSAEAANAIDERLVQGVDANDNGQTLATPLFGEVSSMTVSGLVAAMNPAWDEELTDEQVDERFRQAVAFATGILQREIAGAAAYERARTLVRAAIERAEDPRIVELDRNMPWRRPVTESPPDALFVIYPKSDGWALHAVPVSVDSFENRLDLPAEWGGLSEAELVAATGVPDALFAHGARFYASAASRDGVLALAHLALERSLSDAA
jgi:uncharacterized UPF0160 family protein